MRVCKVCPCRPPSLPLGTDQTRVCDARYSLSGLCNLVLWISAAAQKVRSVRSVGSKNWACFEQSAELINWYHNLTHRMNEPALKCERIQNKKYTRPDKQIIKKSIMSGLNCLVSRFFFALSLRPGLFIGVTSVSYYTLAPPFGNLSVPERRHR